MRGNELNNRQQFGLVLISLCAGFPGILIAGYMPEVANALPLGSLGWLAVSALGAAAGGALYVPKTQFWYVGFLSGLIGGPGALVATYFYSSWRTSMYSLEIVFAMFVGGHLGIVMYKLWYGSLDRNDKGSENAALTTPATH
jgi:hypothetical protein